MNLIGDIIRGIYDLEVNPWIKYFPQIGRLWKKALHHHPIILVGIIDSGVDQDHPDLKNNIFGCTGVDSVFGGDVIGHGTAVAGIVAAEHNNQIGILGISNVSKIFSIKVVGAGQSAIPYNVAKAIQMCMDAGCDIINISLGGRYQSDEMEAACKNADKHNVIIVAPTGNRVNQCMMPASYEEVIAVGATDPEGNPADFSAPGHALATVGMNVYTTLPRGQYGAVSGTSFASPVVAGLASIFRAIDPKISRQGVLEKLSELSSDADYAQFLHLSQGGGRNISLCMKSCPPDHFVV